MKKHLLGFAIFSLIVGTAAFVAALAREVPQPAKQFTYEVSKTSCWKNVRQDSEIRQSTDYGQASVKITQAVLNEKTRKLDTNFFIQRETPSTQKVRVKLTFVNSLPNENGNWDDAVRTEYVILSPNFNVDNNGTQLMISSYQWLGDLNSGENLYVTAEVVNGRSNDLETVPRKINFNDFTPILKINKNRNF